MKPAVLNSFKINIITDKQQTSHLPEFALLADLSFLDVDLHMK